MTLTSTHMFCGGGGDTRGFQEAGFDPTLAINHDQPSIDTHSANFPDTDHWLCDINNMDMRRLPKTHVLWASPICQESSPAGGRRRRKHSPQQLELLEYGKVDDSTWERTRATAYDILRAVEARQGDRDGGYLAVACENVIEFTTWPLFGWWIEAMRLLRMRATVTCVTSAHIGSPANPWAPQWRDRVYIAFIRDDIKGTPDLEPQPLALCVECGENVHAKRWWKPKTKLVAGHRVGKYRSQYLFICPNARCRNAVVEPYVLPAVTAIDLSDVGQRIGDRPRPLAEATRRRIEAGLRMFSGRHITTVNHGGPDVRAYPPELSPLAARTTKIGDGMVTPPAFYVKNYSDGGRPQDRVRSTGEPFGTMTTGRNHSLVWPMLVPCGGQLNTAATSTDEPMRTRMANPKGFEALVTAEPFIAMLRRNGGAESIHKPLATVAAGGNHQALVIPYYRTGRAKPVTAPLDTLTVRDRFALVQGDVAVPEVDDCHLRMLQPREQFNSQRFPHNYELRGNKGEQTAQAGNAVSVNVARWIGEQIAAVLDGRTA